MQDWGEEVEEGAIYNVTLKRVQIQQAANKGARWLGVSEWVPSDVSLSVTESQLTRLFERGDESGSKPLGEKTDHTQAFFFFFRSLNLSRCRI